MTSDSAIKVAYDDYVTLTEITSDLPSNPVKMRAGVLWRYYKDFSVSDIQDFHQTAILAALQFAKSYPADKYKLSEILLHVTRAIRDEQKQLGRTIITEDEEYDSDEYLISILGTDSSLKSILIEVLGEDNYIILKKIHVDGEDFSKLARESFPRCDDAVNKLQNKLRRLMRTLRRKLRELSDGTA